MTTRNRTTPSRPLRLAAAASLAGLLAACGAAEVELVPTVDAAVSTETEPEVEVEPIEEETEDPATDDAEEVTTEEVPVVDAPAPDPGPTTASTSPSTANTGASHAEPDLVVGEDGCVTDRSIGLVIACHDDAAGPDELG